MCIGLLPGPAIPADFFESALGTPFRRESAWLGSATLIAAPPALRTLIGIELNGRCRLPSPSRRLERTVVGRYRGCR